MIFMVYTLCGSSFAAVMPKQPLMVLATKKYYRYEYCRDGIASFYAFRAEPEMEAAEVVPDGSADIIFRCEPGDCGADCYGTRLRFHGMEDMPTIKAGSRIFGMRFLQGQAFLPGNFPESELPETHIDLYNIMKDNCIIDRICESGSFMEQIRIFLSAYLKDYRRRGKNSCKEVTAGYMLKKIIAAKGCIKLESLSREMNYSPRYLNGLFRGLYGIPPKIFCKMVRYQYMLSLVGSGRSMVETASEAGFYDQSHLIREFKSFTGMTPAKYLQKLHNCSFKKRLVIVGSKKLYDNCRQI